MEATDSSSSSERILLVACCSSARGNSSWVMPWPSSLTEMRRMPPPSRRISMALAPASIAFSSNSFRTDAGRSITSPAAIWLTSRSGSGIIRRLDDIGRLALCVFRVERYTFNGFQTVAAYFNRLLYGVGLASIGLAGLLFWCGTMPDLLSMILHIDQYLGVWVEQYGAWIYLVLFLIIFGETGLVVLPFLPGDSLLFIAGAFGASGMLDPV